MRTALRIVGFIIGGLIALVVIVVAGLYLNVARMRAATYSNPVPNITVARTPEQLARGQYMVTALPGCAGCHSSQPSATPPILDGARVADLDALGNFNAPNLTPGGPTKDWSDGQIIRAIREGLDKDGHPLTLMPSPDYHSMSDDDVQAVVAYLRSQPAVPGNPGGVSLSFLGTVIIGTGGFPLSNQPPAGTITAPPRGPTSAYGQYLVSMGGCRTCHGPALDAQNIPQGPPPGPSLRIVKFWTDADFISTMRTGIDPAKHQLSDEMPWRDFGKGTDDDLKAIYQYVISFP
jgi:mono/diheme cytochrome c family protein